MKQFIKRGKSDAHDARHIEAQATPEDHVMHRFLSAMPHKVSGCKLLFTQPGSDGNVYFN
jgi:hypothetical protein